MRKKDFLYGLVIAIFLVTGCQKEIHFNTSPSQGSLQANSTGDCLPKTVNGTYTQGAALVVSTNTITIDVNVTVAGAYLVSSDTLNGYYFRATGVFTSTGTTTITLHGTGTPTVTGTDNFTVTYINGSCSIAVTVVAPGGGGGGAAVYTLAGSPSACTSTVNGTYTVSSALNNTNTVNISVDVSTIGTYTISTTAINGMTFSKSGTFTATGVNTVVLNGSGTPTLTGNNTIPVSAGSSNCSFVIPVASAGSAAQFTIDCTGPFASGVYIAGTALDASNTVDIDVNVTTVGSYNISVTFNGMTFSASGNFSATGNTTITLNGSGTPAVPGSFDIDLPSSCSFHVIVIAAGSIDWEFTIGTTTYQGSTDASAISNTPPTSVYAFEGSNSSGDHLTLLLVDMTGGLQNNETYNSNTLASNGAGFIFSTGTETFTAEPTSSGVNIVAKVTTHNTTTKTITGTFSGTVLDGSNTVRTVTNGSFSGVYQ